MVSNRECMDRVTITLINNVLPERDQRAGE